MTETTKDAGSAMLEDATDTAQSACNGLLGDSIVVETKQCSKCGEIKTISKFRVGRCQCKECIKKYNRQYEQNHLDKKRMRNKLWVLNNSEKEKDRKRRWCINNAEKDKNRKREFYLHNRTRIRKEHHEYYINNKEDFSKRSKEYRINHPKEVARNFDKWKINNKEKYKILKQEHGEKYRIVLKDSYVRGILSSAGVSNPQPWLIEAKRQQILLNRKLKNNTKEALL